MRDLKDLTIEDDWFGLGVTFRQDTRSYKDKKEELHVERDFRWYVEEFSSTSCADPQDKIYGLMRLVPKGQRIPVDYDKPI